MQKSVFLSSICCFIAAVLAANDRPDIEKLLQLGRVDEALALCSQRQGYAAAWSWPLLGNYFFLAADPERALECYQKGVPCRNQALAWCMAADRCRERGDTAGARERYGRAAEVYETLLRDNRCLWNREWNWERLEARRHWAELGGQSVQPENSEKLGQLLDRAEAYCERLQTSLLSYFCEEEVTETTDFSLKIAEALQLFDTRAGAYMHAEDHKMRRIFLYDYQLVSKEGAVSEKRRLLLKNGQVAALENSKLQVAHYRLDKMIYAPIDLFGSGQRQVYEYRLLEEKRDESGPLILVEAVPIVFPTANMPFGRAWLRENGRVERIELNMKSILGYETILAAAHRAKLEPAIAIVSVFGKEFKGIGFPTAICLRDAYLDEAGRELLVSQVDIAYRNYRFFVVEMRVKQLSVK
ncbi:MAG: hypothetical protein NTW95_03465 [Candidatus Aminicenantes bacterium]|nr:hypothetical protein [Candidatus Aminicenantes bacterium]